MSFTRFLWVLVLASGLAEAANIDGTITYQAQIKQNGSPANGTFDFQFKLFDNATVGVGVQAGQTVLVNDVTLANGQLSTNLNFGANNPFDGTQLFLEIGIRDGASNQAYTLLNPRQRLTEVPYSSHSVEADLAILTGANSVNGGSVVDGSLGSVDVNTTQIQRRVTGTCTTGQAIRAVAENGTVTCEPVGGSGGGGTVTSITAGTGLTGGIITTSGTISIATGGVGTSQINSTQVQRRNSAMATACSGVNQSIKTIAEDGTVTCEADDTGGGTSGGWSLTGNSGTTAGTNFVGTTDAQPLVIKANNFRAAQWSFATGSVNGSVNGTGINVVQGDPSNSVVAGVLGATIGGGGRQPNGSGANPNTVTDAYGTVAGGYQNTAGSNDAVVTDALAATVGGGHANTASANDATVAGGSQNTASGVQSTIGGGNFNTATGTNALVPGGRGNNATGTNSVVLGNCGTAAGAGTILISAHQTATSCSQVTANNTESVVVVAGSGGVVLSTGSGAWSSLSDRNSKHDVAPVNSDSILAGVLAMPIATWTYNSQADDIRHMGPMAQDFYAAFNLGEDEKRINSVDIDGVALAAIQGLNAKVERDNAELKQRNAELEAKNAELEARLTRIEQTLLGTEHTAGR